MVNYKNGKIYKIISDKTDKFYVGSTAQIYLSTRMATHKCKHNDCMSKNIGYDLNECSIILIENYPCKDVYELKKREREYYDKYKKECKEVFLNKYKPIRLEGERYEYEKALREKYKEKNKEKVQQYTKDYYNKNKIVCNERSQKYHNENKEKVHKRHKEWRENNKDTIKEREKKNREKNKDTIKEYNKEYYFKNKNIKITCECGSSVLKAGIASHKKSKKHIEYIESN